MNSRHKTLIIYYTILVFPLILLKQINLNDFIIYYLLIYKTLIDGILICYFMKKIHWTYFIPMMGYYNNRGHFSTRNKF